MAGAVDIAMQLREVGIRPGDLRRGTSRQPCPECSPRRRKSNDDCLALTIDNDGAKWFCHHCHWSGRALRCPAQEKIERGTGTKPTPQTIDEELRDLRTRAAAILRRAEPISASNLGGRYLLGRDLEPEIADPAALRFLPSTTTFPPSLVAVVTDIRDPTKLLGLQFTTLRSDATKSDRKFLKGSKPKGGVIRLIEDAEVVYDLGMAEGAETALAVMTSMRRAGRQVLPIWSAMSAGNLADLPVVAGIDRLQVFGDRDRSGTGQAAAGKLAQRWRAAGREVFVRLPPTGDWND